ncbi:MAG: radical SAM protein [Acidobacteriota bacterium]
MPSSEVLKAYDASRDAGTDVSVLCHAPFLSLNFDQSGRVTACCFNREYVLGTYPEQNIDEIWRGQPAAELRRAFHEGSVAPGCDRCFHQLESRNFSGALMRNFDRFSKRGKGRAANVEGPPLVLEFELSNTCTLECVMCGGHWSSTIRAKREKLPPLKNPYDAEFVRQIEEFLPSVRAVRFLGGEPFLITRYHELWDSIQRLNPDLEVSITTSGAVVPARPRKAIEGIKASFIISLDGITKATYERIRQNAIFEEVMANIADLHDYTKRRGTGMTVACCPMTHNWHELSGVVDFAETRGLGVFFNTVTFPIESSLAGLSASELSSIIDTLDAQGREARWTSKTQAQWASLLSQLRAWLTDKQDFLAHSAREAGRIIAILGLGHAPASSSKTVVGTTFLQRILGRRQPEVSAPADTDPAGIASLIAPVVLVRSVETAKGHAAQTTELLCSLPALPLHLWPADATPSPALLLAAVAAVAAATDESAVDLPQQLARVKTVLDREESRPGSSDGLAKAGNWLRKRLDMAQWSVAVRGVKDLIVALESGRPLAAASSDLGMRVHAILEGSADDSSGDHGLRHQLATVLVSQRGPIDFGEAESSTRPPEDEWLVPATVPIALDVIDAFHSAVYGRADTKLAARLQLVREVINVPEAAAAIGRVSFVQAYDFISMADDASFEGALRSFQKPSSTTNAV